MHNSMWVVFRQKYVYLTSFFYYILIDVNAPMILYFLFTYKKSFINNDTNKNLSIFFIFLLVQIKESRNEK